MSPSCISGSIINLGECPWIKMAGFWYMGRGETMGVMLAGNPELNIMGCIGIWEPDEFGRE
jgi:hypothetical protein